jgi:CRP-like cAMP-binding protein
LQTLAQKKKNFSAYFKLDIYHYSANEVIIQEGSTDKRHFFIALRGLVNIVKNTSEVTIAKLKDSQTKRRAIFGEISYISKRCRTTSAIAGSNVIALKNESKNNRCTQSGNLH